jgi:FkbM family methyltransferase
MSRRRGALTERIVELGLWGRSPFFLVDVGCSGGIEKRWRSFGTRLHGVGFDPLIAEVERLNGLGADAGVIYEAACVSCHNYEERFPSAERVDRVRSRDNQPFLRTSSFAAQGRTATSFTQSVFNAGAPVVLTDRHITLDDWAAQNQRSVDFLKIDTDGHDIAVLLGAERLLSEGDVLGVKIEAQFHGPIHPFANTFHNIDGFLRDHGFTLFDLNQRRYSRAALPDAFFGSRPGRTRTGQLMWGDALYLRDLAPADYERMFAFNVSSERVMKLACLFDLFDLPDCAAELLTSRADFLDADMREQLLDLLVSGAPGSYRARLAAFNSDFTSFYPDRMPAEDGEQALVGRLQERIKELRSRNAGLRDLAARRRDRIKRLTARLERTPPNQRASTIPGRFGFGSFDRWLFLPLLIPAVLILAGHSSFGFDPPGFLDAFVYVGYFWHYPEHLWVFDDNSNYKISRLPWILPGYLAHSLAGTTGAAYLLAYFPLALGALATYLLIRDGLHDRTAAAVVSVAWACCTWAHGVGGWSYHVLAASAYYMMACWLAVRVARQPSTLAAVLAGVFLTGAIHTHLFLVVFTPFVLLLHWAALPQAPAAPLARSLRAALWAAGGGVALTLILSVINGATGGDWLFFLPQIEHSWRLSQPGSDRWWLGMTAWMPSARHLIVPVLLLIASLPVLVLRQRGPDHRLAISLVASGWIAFAVMCFFQFVRHMTMLDYPYMAFPLYIHAFPAIGAMLATTSVGVRGRWPLIAVATAAVVMLGSLLLLMPAALPRWLNAASAAIGLLQAPLIVAPLLLGLAGVAIMLAMKPQARYVTFAVWFSLVNVWVAPSPDSYGIGTPGYRRAMLSLFHDADRLTTELDPSLIGIKYWWSVEQVTTPTGRVPLAPVFDSFVATRGWLANLFARKSPGLPIEQLTAAQLDRGECIGVLSSIESQARLREQMESHFAALGRPLHEVAARRFEEPELSFALTILKPSGPPPSVPRPPCAPAVAPAIE